MATATPEIQDAPLAPVFAVDDETFFDAPALGALFDEPDDRDHLFEEYLSRGTLSKDAEPLVKVPPKAYFLKPLMPGAVYNQGVLGSCTAQEAVKQYEFLLKKQGAPALVLSRLQVYYNSRTALSPTYARRDTGSTGRATSQVLAKFGAAPETMWPYEDTGYRFATPPPPEVQVAGEQHQVFEYLSIPAGTADTIRLLKASLAEGFPVGFSMNLTEEFKPDRWGLFKEWGGAEVGGHRMLLTGFSDWVNRVQVLNSWGGDWGRDGYCAIPYNIIEERGRDFWTFRRVEQ